MSFDGRTVEFTVAGPTNAADLLIFHVGTPSAAVEYPALARAAAGAGMRTATYSRAGYGGSTRWPGRSVADEALLSASLVDLLGYRTFFTIGWSGGGPAALACAALLPDRVQACLTVAGLAPPREMGRAWRQLWSADVLEEWDTLASGGTRNLEAKYVADLSELRRTTVRSLAAESDFTEADRRSLVDGPDIGPPLARSMRRAVARGTNGYWDDNLAHARDWGFAVAAISVPVVVRHGEDDLTVNVESARWLARAIPEATAQIVPGAGHISVVHPFEEMISALVHVAWPTVPGRGKAPETKRHRRR